LKAGRTYRLTGQVNYAAGNTNAFDYQWYNVTSGAAIPGSYATNNSSSNTADPEVANGLASAVITPLVDTTIELRFTAISSITSISSAFAYVETIDSPQPVTQTVDYMFARLTTAQSFTSNSNLNFTTVSNNGIANDGTNFTLSAGKTYELSADVAFNTGALGDVTIFWANTSNTQVGSSTVADVMTANNGASTVSQTSARTIFTPTVDTQVRVRVGTIVGGSGGTWNLAGSNVIIKQLGATTQTTSSICPTRWKCNEYNTCFLGSLDSNASSIHVIKLYRENAIDSSRCLLVRNNNSDTCNRNCSMVQHRWFINICNLYLSSELHLVQD
jgi:hypothetical protein